MANEFSADKASLHDHRLKQQRLVFEVTLSGNATAADKGRASDIPGVALIRAAGQTTDVDAVEDLSAQVPAAADATGVYAILVDVQPSKLYSITVTGGATSQTGLSTGGRPLIEMATTTDLTNPANSDTIRVEIEYKE